LTSVYRILCLDTCLGEPPEVFFPSLGVDEMEGFVASVETILDERAKHSMMLVDAVEERANMTVPAESARGELRGLRGDIHILTFAQERRILPGEPVDASDSIPPPASDATGHSDGHRTV
jgi:hypothetical protein